MLKTIKLPEGLEDTLKVLLAIKVFVFVLLGAIESSLVINESYLLDECVEKISGELNLNHKDHKLSQAKAVHFCAGGNLIDSTLIN